MTMVASVLHLDRRAIKQLRITDPYSLHRVVYSLYEDVRTEEQKRQGVGSGILFANDGGYEGGRRVLLLANRPPAEKVEGEFGNVESKVINPAFLSHSHYRFKVVINATQRDNTNRKLNPIVGRLAITDWFVEKAKQTWGFEVIKHHVRVENMDVLVFKGKAQRFITISQATLFGQFVVQDKDKFVHSFKNGIGRAKTFGCGLLQIVPILEIE